MKKPPTKQQRDEAFVAHNVPLFLKSMDRVNSALRKLDCAVAECRLYASMVAPSQKKGGRK